MDLLDKVKVGDLRALTLIRDGFSTESAGLVLGSAGNQIRDRLRRIEQATGREVYVRRQKSSRHRAILTEAGYLLANYADEVLEIIDGAAAMVKDNAKQK